MDTVKKIMKLKSEGLSLRAIADRFNSEAVSTPSGKGKWGHEMVKRVIAESVLKKAEVKVGLTSENEIRLKEEVEALKAEQVKMLDVIVMLRGQQKIMSDTILTSGEIEKEMMAVLESENAEKQQEVEALKAEVKRLQSELDTVRQKNKSESLTRNIETLTTQKETFRAESERLQRLLNSAEGNYRQQHQDVLNSLGSELAIANQTIQELRDKQSFLSVDDTLRGKLGVPKNHAGWTTQINGLGYIRLFRKLSGNQHSVYIGKVWDTDTVDKKIEQYQEKKIAQLKFAIRKDTDEQLPVPLAPRFEDSLRMCCSEQRRTYRLDKVRLRFPSMNKIEFNRNMLGLAAEYKIELVGGDPRECDMDALIRNEAMGITYVNFEWRDSGAT